LTIDDSERNPPGLALPDACYLGDVFKANEDLVQLIEVDLLLGVDVRNLLYPEDGHAA
jgi:hypothetical protein